MENLANWMDIWLDKYTKTEHPVMFLQPNLAYWFEYVDCAIQIEETKTAVLPGSAHRHKGQ